MPKTEQWPHNFTSLDKGVTKLAQPDDPVWGWTIELDTTDMCGEGCDVCLRSS